MNKELIKCYECLDLAFNATIEDIQARTKALIKIYNNKAVETGNSYDKQIGQVEASAEMMIENINKNGIPDKDFHHFKCSWQSVGWLTVALLFVGIICYFSFYIFK